MEEPLTTFREADESFTASASLKGGMYSANDGLSAHFTLSSVN